MKIKQLSIVVISLIVLQLGSGCSSVGKALDTLPEGSAESIDYTRTGKFSSTTIEVQNFEKSTTEVSADVMRVQHSNAWISNIEFTAKGYKRKR